MRRKLLFPLLLLGVSCNCLQAGTIIISGFITQSTPDGTGPASFNSSLNNIQDVQPYTLTLQLAETISGPGLYSTVGSSLSFDVPAAPASETQFNSIIFTITPDGALDDFSISACITGEDCSTGNQATANFSVPASDLNQTNVTAAGLDQPHPFDLLEDDGETDIQGSITAYSGTAVTMIATVPEPRSYALFIVSLLGMAGRAAFRKQSIHT